MRYYRGDGGEQTQIDGGEATKNVHEIDMDPEGSK